MRLRLPFPLTSKDARDAFLSHLAQAFHLEVVGGLIHVLAPYAETTTVYLHPLNFPDRPADFGFVNTVRRHKVSRFY